MQIKIARVCTVPFFVMTQLEASIRALRKAGSEVVVITSDDELSQGKPTMHGAEFVAVEMSREISPLTDLRSLISLYRLFRSRQFDIVHSTTPKAGLLCAIAGWLARVPIRLHTFTGQPWVTMTGTKKWILKGCDKVIGYLNTCCYTDGDSQKEFLINNNIVSARRLSVLGDGSVAGVDLNRFNPDKYDAQQLSNLREELQIAPQEKIIIFVGRITQDKGIRELLSAFKFVLIECPLTTLLLVGPCEPDGVELIESATNDPLFYGKIKTVGFTSEPEKYMRISDFLCLPSYREGFGTVVIEAAAMGLPTVATNIYGLTDAVVDGITGRLVNVRDPIALGTLLSELIQDTEELKRLSLNARKRAVEKFDSVYFSKLLITEYERLSELRNGSH